MPKLDTLVLDQLADRIFQPERLGRLLEDFIAQSAETSQQRRQQGGRIKAELTETEGALARLLSMVEKGLMDVDDPALVERLQSLKRQRAKLQQELDTLAAAAEGTAPLITPAKLTRLATEMRKALHAGPPDLRKVYMRLFVNKVTVSKDVITITGPKSALASSATAELPAAPSRVLIFVQEWRAACDETGHWSANIYRSAGGSPS